MPYNIVDTSANGYALVVGEPFADYDAGQTFLNILGMYFPAVPFAHTVVSERRGNGNRREVLYRMNFNGVANSEFYVYTFQTEGGGRGNLPNEARIQWRQHSQWSVDLNTLRPAANFQAALGSANPNLTGLECYLFSFYKRNLADDEIVISATYPTQAQDVEYNGVSNKSIQYQYPDIRDAFTNGVSATPKGNNERIIHFKPQYLIWYMINRDALHLGTLQEYQNLAAALLQPPVPVAVAIPLDVPRNKIIYGAPGTGKSYELRQQILALGFAEENTKRITFHPNYNYQQFIGTYKPTPIYKTAGEGQVYYGSDKITLLNAPENKEPLIDYSFVQGPLLKQLANALTNRNQYYLIIVEEINRAPVSAVFGDFFQLLDRAENGVSEYDIELNSDASNYLRSLGIDGTRVRLPQNLFIWATMNSADQGVMPMDAAFKRRWTFEYLPLNAKANIVEGEVISYQNRQINWNHFRGQVNRKLTDLNVPEDKLIGPFFLNAAELANQDTIKNKLLLYLRDDVVRHNADSLFVRSTFSEIVADYDAGRPIFQNLEFDNVVEVVVAAEVPNPQA